MATKKTTKSKSMERREAIMIAAVPKPAIPTQADRVIGALASLQASEGWAIVRKIIDENIAYLEQAIINKIDPETKEALNDAEIEVCRLKRSINIDVRDTPDNYCKEVMGTGEVPENYDPYFKTKEEIDKARRPVPA